MAIAVCFCLGDRLSVPSPTRELIGSLGKILLLDLGKHSLISDLFEQP